MNKFMHYIGLDVHKETGGDGSRPGGDRGEPIYSLRFRRHSEAMARQAPGEAGK